MAEVASHCEGNPQQSTETRTLELHWNGCDDAGNRVPDGRYRVRGLSSPGLSVSFEYSFYNPGSPPWLGYPNSGWGGDHAFPQALVTIPPDDATTWRVVIAGEVGEGGDTVFALDANSNKVWGTKRHWWGPRALAYADGEIWAAFAKDDVVMKYRVDSGGPAGFRRPAGTVNQLKVEEPIFALAVGATEAALLLEKSNVVRFIDRVSGKKLADYEPAAKACRNSLAFDGQGRLLVSTAKGVMTLQRDGEKVSSREVALTGLEKAGAIHCDRHGTIFVADLGADRQIKMFDAATLAFKGAIGRRGGQQGLLFDKHAVHSPVAMSADHLGQLWVAEDADPRRVVVFKSEDGTFVRHFVGNTRYSATNASLHSDDPTLAYCDGVIFKIDRSQPQAYEPLAYVWSGPKPGSPFGPMAGPPPQGFSLQYLFSSTASGRKRHYLLSNSQGFPVLFVGKETGSEGAIDYRPCSAVCGASPERGFPERKDDPKGLWLWQDLDEDEAVDEDELQPLPGKVTGKVGWFYGMMWPMGVDLAWHCEGHTITPVRFSEAGAPMYDISQARKLSRDGGPFIRVGAHLVGTENDVPFQSGRYVFLDLDGNLVGTYPCHWIGVHGSMAGPVPGPGQTCGELFFSGIARHVSDEIGDVIASHGNYGQAYLFTEDGLFISSLFKDHRQNPSGKGPSIERARDWTDVTMGQECFGGWFGKQSDGVVRYVFGSQSADVVRIVGLDEVKRFRADDIVVGSSPVVAAASPARREDRQHREEHVTSPADGLTMPVPNVANRGQAITVDGNLDDWQGIRFREIRSGTLRVGTVAMAHDAKNLFLAYDVVDETPLANANRDLLMAFKEGDCVDLMIGPDRADPGEAAAAGDERLLLVPPPRGAPDGHGGTSVLYRPVAAESEPEKAMEFSSPVRTIRMQSVGVVDGATIRWKKTESGFVCEARVPFETLGLDVHLPGMILRGDLGILSSNPGGVLTDRRCYLFNRRSNVVADTPSEAELLPAHWGRLILQ